MNKTVYYGKRPNGPYQYPYNYIHTSFTGYPHSNKKNYFFKNRSNIQLNNNNYFEPRKKNYYNNNNNFNYFNDFSNGENSHHSSVFQNFQKNRHRHRYNAYFTEEKKIAEEINNDSVNEEEVKEEVLKIRVNVSDNQCKELVICKDDDINEKIIDFCKDNNISEKLVEPLYNKVDQSLKTLEIINNMSLNKNDYLILDKIRNIADNNNKDN